MNFKELFKGILIMTCIEDTYWFLRSQPNQEDFTIIHALVERSRDKLIHPHAVIYNEKTGNIHEVSNKFKNKNVVLPFPLWVALGNVTQIKKYTLREYNDLLIKHKKWEFYHLNLN